MRAIIEWFVDNPIAVNIMLIAVVVGGWTGMGSLKKEVFPDAKSRNIQVSVFYLGATPLEVEQQITIPIEEAISEISGIFQITSISKMGKGIVNVEVAEGYEVDAVLNEVKSHVGTVNNFPDSSERPEISVIEQNKTLMIFSISGDVRKSYIKPIASQIRDEMSMLDGVSGVVVDGMADYEVSVDVSEHDLRRFNITISDIASSIRSAYVDVPIGSIKTSIGSVQIRGGESNFSVDDLQNIVVRSYPNGTKVVLGDVAKIHDGYEVKNVDYIVNGNPGLVFDLKIGDDADLFKATESALSYLQKIKNKIPRNLVLSMHYKSVDAFNDRLNLLKNNFFSGLLLVFIILMLFLRPLIAFWVVVGIVTSLAGAVWLLQYFEVSLNMLSMFSFLMVLGIVVDDAIIVGESIYSRHASSNSCHKFSVEGATCVIKPVVLAVISTVVFFTPLLWVPDQVLPLSLSIFYVVSLCLVFSLLESFLILPSHLSYMKRDSGYENYALRKLDRFRQYFSNGMDFLSSDIYKPYLKVFLMNKVSTLLGFMLLFFLSLSLIGFGWVKVAFFPTVPQPYITVDASFIDGAPYQYSVDLASHFSEKANHLKRDDELLIENDGKNFIESINTISRDNTASLFLELTSPQSRNVSIESIVKKLKEIIGPLPDVKNYTLNYSYANNSPDVELHLRLNTNSPVQHKGALSEIQAALNAYPGITNVRDDFYTGRVEVKLSMKDSAHALGITMTDISNQIRQAYQGEDVKTFPRLRESVNVILRYPEIERDSLYSLKSMRIRSSSGVEMPLDTLVNIDLVAGPKDIRRVDLNRSVTIMADVLEGYDPKLIVDDMLSTYLSQWEEKYVGLKISEQGSLRIQSQFGDDILSNFIWALIVVFVIFAIALKSVFEPLLILIAVPFGFMGSVFGHLILGYDVSMMSFFGFLACSGVVVNDNLVLLNRINQLREEGINSVEAVINAGVDRFRPILLTTFTTFIGLMPILLERSTQAQFLKPMVVAMSFGILISSLVTLVVVPCLYMSGYNISNNIFRFMCNGERSKCG